MALCRLERNRGRGKCSISTGSLVNGLAICCTVNTGHVLNIHHIYIYISYTDVRGSYAIGIIPECEYRGGERRGNKYCLDSSTRDNSLHFHVVSLNSGAVVRSMRLTTCLSKPKGRLDFRGPISNLRLNGSICNAAGQSHWEPVTDHSVHRPSGRD